MHPGDAIATDLARSQGGVITRKQATEAGLTYGQVRRRLQGGHWQSVRGGYRLFPADNWLDLVRSALTVLPSSVVSHESAAEIHRIPMVESGLATVSVHSRTTHGFPGVTIRRCHDLLESHVEERAGLRVTTVPRTVVDLAIGRSERHIGAIVEDLLAAKRMTPEAFAAVVGDVARRGRPGSANLRRIVAGIEGVDIDSTRLEKEGRQVLSRGGCPPPIPEYPIPWALDRRFDDAYPDECLAIEWDSVRWHLRLDRFQMDRFRDRQALVHGWRVLRFTWFDVKERPDEVVGTVRAALAA